ncbi:hypothetical protein L596_015373 [Steinernema carpocapsae]|uniref:Uncharacterized protein n=1 Tax=Steinernema carpocapsae TaxID=34508 RepID=A0A4U5NFD5_STECR|nr:hypothetical protein L596_015373 [Steinernema carpocapsae]
MSCLLRSSKPSLLPSHASRAVVPLKRSDDLRAFEHRTRARRGLQRSAHLGDPPLPLGAYRPYDDVGCSGSLMCLRIIYGDCLCGTLLWRRRKRLMESMTSLNSITIEDLHDRRKKIISEIEPRLTLPLHPPTMNRRVRAAPPPPKPRRPKATRQRRSSDGPFENLDGTLNSL